MNSRRLPALATSVLLGITALASAGPLTSRFTYQGTLKQAGAPVSATADMTFALFNDPNAGSQVGPTLTFDGVGGNPAPVAVVGGLFTVQLDFGAAPFDGQELWLAISVRTPSGAGAYVPLNPRQRLTAAPFALYALNSPGAGLWDTTGTATYNTADTFVGINRSTKVTGNEYFGIQAPVNAGFGGMYIRTNGANGVPFYGYSNGASAAWTYFDGANGFWGVYNGGADRIVVSSEGDVGIGDTTPDARLDVHTSATHGITGTTTAASSYGVYGSGTSAGVYGVSGASNGAGVYGEGGGTGTTGVEGHADSSASSGVAGYNTVATGVYGSTWTGYGVYGTNGGSNSSGYAGYFNGRLHVAGQLSKSSGSFKIDHPLDPANKYLYHSFVESPEMMNVYNGVIATDASGYAVVQLPDYFQALNRDFRYQLTVVDASDDFVLAKVVREVEKNTFTLRTSKGNVKVSWQVTGVRQDAYAQANRIVVEEDKPEGERGKFIHPELFGASAEENVSYHAIRSQDAR